MSVRAARSGFAAASTNFDPFRSPVTDAPPLGGSGAAGRLPVNHSAMSRRSLPAQTTISSPRLFGMEPLVQRMVRGGVKYGQGLPWPPYSRGIQLDIRPL